MTWSPAFPNSPRLLPLAAAIIAALSVPMLAHAQMLNGMPVALGVPDISIVTGTAGVAPPDGIPPSAKKPKSQKNCPQTAEAEFMTGSPDRVMYLYDDVEVSQCDTDVVSDRGLWPSADDAFR